MNNRTDALEHIRLINVRIKELQDIIPKVAFTHKYSYDVLRHELALQKILFQDETSYAIKMGWL